MRHLLTGIFAGLVAVASAAPTGAQNSSPGPIVVSQAWVRASLGHAPNASSYLTIENKGDADRLIGARSPAARKLELHSHTLDGHTARMRPVTAIPIPAGGTVKLDPNGYHIMFLALKAPLREGDRVAMVLVFEKAGPIDVAVDVRYAPTQMPQHAAPDSTTTPSPAPSSPTPEGSTTLFSTPSPSPPVTSEPIPAPPSAPSHSGHSAPSN